MLGIVSMAGNALKAFGNTHPAVKWGVIVLAFLLAAEFVANEGINLYERMATVRYKVEQQNAETSVADINAATKNVLAIDPRKSGPQRAFAEGSQWREVAQDRPIEAAPTAPSATRSVAVTRAPSPIVDEIVLVIRVLLVGGAFSRMWRATGPAWIRGVAFGVVIVLVYAINQVVMGDGIDAPTIGVAGIAAAVLGSLTCVWADRRRSVAKVAQ